MKAVIYARYSTDNQREESIEGQLRECREYAKRNDILVLNTYIDRAMSAKTDNRPNFLKMIKDSSQGLFDIILVWKLDRFARNRYDSAHYKSILKRNGVKVVSARETIADDSTGVLLESLLEGYAEFYSVELSEKVKRGHTENALKCKYNGGYMLMGYRKNRDQEYEIDPQMAPIVSEVFQRYVQGHTIRGIIEWLNALGIRSGQNKPISINNVTKMLKNRKYMGEYRYGEVIVPNGMPAIVSVELFERVQKKMEKNKRAPARHKAEDDYLLTTKLFCGKCGALMVGECGTSRTKTVYRYYKCVNTKKRHTCDKKAVRKDWIENLVVQQTMARLMDDSAVNYIVDIVFELQARENLDLPVLKNELYEAEKGIENMLNAIQQGVLTASTTQRLKELESRKSDLEVRIIQEKMQKPQLSREQIVFWIQQFRKLDVNKQSHRKQLIDNFVNAVYLYDDKIIITFNYKDGSKTVSLKEVESSDLESLAPPFCKQKAMYVTLLFL